MVTILLTDSSSYWGDAIITAVPSTTTFQYAHSGADIAVQASPGVVALAYVAVLDNAVNTHLIDISYDRRARAASLITSSIYGMTRTPLSTILITTRYP
jgi:hypothetical protein